MENEYSSINDEKIIKEIENIAINNLNYRFRKININEIYTTPFKKDLLKIKQERNKNQRIKKIKLFLISQIKELKEASQTPLNYFSKDCYVIYKKHFN